MRPNFGRDDEDDLIQRAHRAHEREVKREDPRYQPVWPHRSFVELRGKDGEDVAYVVLTWQPSIGEEHHKVYRCTRGKAGRVRLTLLDSDAYVVTKSLELRLRGDAAKKRAA